MLYTPQYMRHFQTPQNIGDLEDAQAVEEVHFTGQGCFDRIRIFAKLDDGKIGKVTYRVRGCSGTIAACSAMSELAVGLPLEQAASLQGEDVARELGGVPDRKRHSVDLAAEALRTVAAKLTSL
jgi:NifU-like protein involved in Fe-S cluster formation